MGWLLVWSILCLVDVQHQEMLRHNTALGCQAFAVWENANGTPRYWILHCPDGAAASIRSDGRWTQDSKNE